MIEEWKPVVGYEGHYEVSNLGMVRSIPRLKSDGRRNRGKMLDLQKRDIYHAVHLHKNGKPITFAVHRLVMIAFIGMPLPGQCARHLDGNSYNNRIDNLTWGTMQENHDDKKRHGTTARGINNHSAILNEAKVLAIRASRKTGVELAKEFGVTTSAICSVRKRHSWAHV